MRRLGYLAMTGGAVALFFIVQAFGRRFELGDVHLLQQPAAAAPTSRFVHILLALVAIVVLARLIGLAFRKLGQPPVIGEIASGIVLGPSLFGHLAPAASAWLLPADIAPFLRVISEVGVVIYMFLVGIDLHVGHLRHRMGAAIGVSHASIVAPFVLGTLLALWLYPRWGSSTVGFGAFALFVAVSMSVTAFPVLARILTDRGMQATELGTIALACAAVDDVTAWCLLALLVGVAHTTPDAVLLTVGLAIAFVTFVLLVIRPAAARLARECEQREAFSQTTFTIVCVTVLLAAVATEMIGIHALFGAFLIGVMIPHESRLARELRIRLGDMVLVLLLPAFFAFTGMRTEIGLLDSAQDWLACGVIIAVAASGKLGGSAIAARITGLGWRQSLALGVLMNTRGLMELVVLNIGLDLGVVTPTLFTMFVIMALVATVATTPVLNALVRGVPTPPSTSSRSED